METEATFTLEPHICMRCGGRILRFARPGMTPGGNPLFRCADCGAQKSGFGPNVLCWCGYAHRGQHLHGYVCVPFSAVTEHPQLRAALLACGCDPDNKRSEIGIVRMRDYTTVMQNVPAK